MGFLSKKNLLVSLLALSLSACTTPTPKPIKDNTIVDLPCTGDPSPQDVAKSIKFEIAPGSTSTCTLQDVDFIKDTNKNYQHFKKTKPATSTDPTVVFTYDGQPLSGDAPFYYIVNTPKTAGGGGGGVIH